jgi:D-inositol-3-phosphate glycosyltransferase
MNRQTSSDSGGEALSVVLLTGGSDKPYASGLAGALSAAGVRIELIGSDELNCAEIVSLAGLTFFNLRGEQSEDAPVVRKARRIARYYFALMRHVARTGAPVLHILWNNKFELFDRSLLMAYYRCLGRRVVLTAHNVNTAARDGRDNWLNRASLRLQYRLCEHVFVHTRSMKAQLVRDFGVQPARVTVIPFGINDTTPKTPLTATQARARLGIDHDSAVLLFFGQIAPYKGIEYLVEALALVHPRQPVTLVIAGKVKRGNEGYWTQIDSQIRSSRISNAVVTRIGFVPDDEVETFFKAADAVVLPYTEIFQSGVPFLAFSFGKPVIASDVGELRNDVTPATGLLCRPRDSADLSRAIQAFCSDVALWRSDSTRDRIRAHAEEHHSWDLVARLTRDVYAALLSFPGRQTRAEDTERTSQCRE